MARESDLVDAKYTSPSGKVFSFHYDSNLSSETDLKTATFTFPERDGALVVPLGLGGRRFDLTCFFYGKYAKKQADNFEEGLKERGYGELQHPLYGTHKVVPTGTIKRSDDTVRGMNVSSVGITFAETIIELKKILNSEVVDNDLINSNVDAFEKKAAFEMAKDFVSTAVKGVIWVGNQYKKGLKTVTDVLDAIVKVERDIYTAYQTIEFELYSSLDDLVNSVDTVAIQTIKLFRLPGEISTTAGVKVEAYARAVKGIISDFKNDPAGMVNAKNQWATTRMMLESLVVACSAGVALGSSNGKSKFHTREEAVEAAIGIMDVYDSVVEYEEKNVGKDFFVETGEGFEAMRDVVSQSVSHIINNSFSLPTKKTILLTYDRQIVELVYSLYGSLDKLDEFILDNKINYNEIEVLPMGREVAYYV